jgi:hypothetical protein
LCLDIRDSDPSAASDEALASSWFPSLLYPVADTVVAEWIDVRGMLQKFRVITLAEPAITKEANALADETGMVGFLLGLPVSGGNIDAHLYTNRFFSDLGLGLDECAVGVFPVKPLTADEYRWAKDHGNDGDVLLAEAFLQRGDGAQHWAGRPSVLVQPTFP